MNKSILILVIVLALNANAQPPVTVVHGSNASIFFFKTGNVTYKLLADEIWISDNQMIKTTNAIFQPILSSDVYEIPEIEHDSTNSGIDYILSCTYGKWLYGKTNVKCGPYLWTGTHTCRDVNSTACSVTQTLNDGRVIMSWSSDGDFKWF